MRLRTRSATALVTLALPMLALAQANEAVKTDIALPAGAVHTTINGKEYFVSNGEWFLPSAGANGVYYTVVPAP